MFRRNFLSAILSAIAAPLTWFRGRKVPFVEGLDDVVCHREFVLAGEPTVLIEHDLNARLAEATKILRELNKSRSCPCFKAQFGDGPHISDYPDLKNLVDGKLDGPGYGICLSASQENGDAFARIGIMPLDVDPQVVTFIYLARAIAAGRRGSGGSPLTVEDIEYAVHGRWIPSTERLPATKHPHQLLGHCGDGLVSDFVLVTVGGEVSLARYFLPNDMPDRAAWLCRAPMKDLMDWCRGIDDPTHWRPLPQPPAA